MIDFGRVHPLAPVLALDLDGTIGDYYEHFRWFCELYLQKPVKMQFYPGYRGDFAAALSLDKATYRAIKLAYRQGGMKRCMPVFDKVRENIQYIRSLGIQVWITTTRPYLRLDNIDPDTRFWLERNAGRIDGVLYGEEKYADLIDIVGRDRVLGAIDDLPQNYRDADDLGIPVALKTTECNKWWRNEMANIGIHEAHTMDDVAGFADFWKEQRDALQSQHG